MSQGCTPADCGEFVVLGVCVCVGGLVLLSSQTLIPAGQQQLGGLFPLVLVSTAAGVAPT